MVLWHISNITENDLTSTNSNGRSHLLGLEQLVHYKLVESVDIKKSLAQSVDDSLLLFFHDIKCTSCNN